MTVLKPKDELDDTLDLKTLGLSAGPQSGRVAAVQPSLKESVMDSSGSVVSADGGVTAFHDGGGHILANCRLVLIYWGSAWAKSATTPSQAAFTGAVNSLVSGPWATQLAQYRGIGPLSVEKVVSVTASDPPTSFTDPNVQALVDGQINAGAVPKPDGADRVYCVLMPTGHSSGDNAGDVGQHQFSDHNGSRIYWCWVTNDGTLTGGNSIPKVLSHEVAEAVSDPDIGSGILVDVGTETNQEIGDVCNGTWATVNGAAQEAYWSNADNRCVIPVSQPFPALAGDPVLVQSRFGKQGNFEMVAPLAAGGLGYFWRNDDSPFFPWSAATTIGAGAFAAVTMIQSNFGSPGDMEVVARAADKLSFFWRDSGPAFHWNGPFALVADGTPAAGVSGDPVLVQSRFGKQGNFEMVAPLAAGGLGYFWRDNDNPAFPWHRSGSFGAGGFDAVTMIQSNFGNPGNMEVVARQGGKLFAFWRDSGPALHWNGPAQIAGGVTAAGNPVLIQSRFGKQGNFEMVTPLAGGGLAHLWRNNDDPAFPWSAATVFGAGLGVVDAVTLIQSNFGSPGNLEVVCRVGAKTFFFWRDSGPALHWNGPFELTSTTW